MYGPGSVGVAEGLPWPGAGVAGAWVLAEEASRTWWIARNFVALLGDVEEPVWGVGAGPAAPPGAWLPCADPDFEAVHEGMDPAGLPPPVTAGEAFGFLLLGEPHGQRALAAEQVPLLLARGSIAGNSAVATCVAMLTDLRAMTAREGVTWRAAKARADAGPPWDTDPASRAGDAMRALIGGMDALLAGLPAHVASALETGDAAGLERIFSRAWGAPSGEKFAHQMLVLLGAQCAARSHMAVGREPGCDPQEEAEDERAFLASPSFPEAAAHAVAGVQLAKAMFEANPSPTFLGPHSAVAMLRLGSVLLLSQRALEASDPAAAALSAGLAATCARLMRLTLAHAPYKAHGARISRELLERAEGAGRAVGDVVAEAAGVLQAVDG
ncbi:hypothetical protein DFJ74DRAFT_685487 [Hyaloraphidium curvatum]|nr:hypothetical protein DFJ74DRAFT_685487 [Hyaloraphidium curvatum]